MIATPRPPIIAISQLNRGSEQRTDKRRMLSDLRESDSIEQDADVVLLLHRPDMYEQESERLGEADFIIAKDRFGRPGTVTVSFQCHYSRFVDIAKKFGQRAATIQRARIQSLRESRNRPVGTQRAADCAA